MKFLLENEDMESRVTVDIDEARSEIPGMTPIHVAALYGLTGTVGKILAKCDSLVDIETDLGGTAIYCAALNNHLETVKFLVRLGFNPNTPDCYGSTPIMKAAGMGHFEIVKYLTAKMEEPNTPDEHGETPIHVSAEAGYTEIVKYLASKAGHVMYKNRVLLKGRKKYFWNFLLIISCKQGNLESRNKLKSCFLCLQDNRIGNFKKYFMSFYYTLFLYIP